MKQIAYQCATVLGSAYNVIFTIRFIITYTCFNSYCWRWRQPKMHWAVDCQQASFYIETGTLLVPGCSNCMVVKVNPSFFNDKKTGINNINTTRQISINWELRRMIGPRFDIQKKTWYSAIIWGQILSPIVVWYSSIQVFEFTHPKSAFTIRDSCLMDFIKRTRILIK